MQSALAAKDILALAESRTPADRERLMLALVDLCAANKDSEPLAEPARALMNSVFMTLVSGAEREIRRALAERLHDAEWAPHGLINVLALDEIEIAGPIIAASPVLDDQDLVRLLALATVEHQIAVAARPCIGETVVEAILKQSDPAVLTALAGNETADISPQSMSVLLEAARQVASLRSPLVRHPRLTGEMSERLYMWVGQSLRSAIVSRFKVDAARLDRELAKAVNTAQGGATVVVHPTGFDTDRREMESRLVAKLAESGQLRPGYLIKALRDQRLSLFVATLAQLTGLEMRQIDRLLASDKPELLALACYVAGVDKGAFGAVLTLTRNLNRGHPAGGAEGDKRAQAAFAIGHPSKALAALKQILEKESASAV